MTKKDLGSSLTKLAQKLVDQALEEDVSIDTRNEVLKNAGTFHINATKIKLKMPDDDDEAPNFGNFRKKINGASRETEQ